MEIHRDPNGESGAQLSADLNCNPEMMRAASLTQLLDGNACAVYSFNDTGIEVEIRLHANPPSWAHQVTKFSIDRAKYPLFAITSSAISEGEKATVFVSDAGAILGQRRYGIHSTGDHDAAIQLRAEMSSIAPTVSFDEDKKAVIGKGLDSLIRTLKERGTFLFGSE